jgi:hypothetical protein
MITDHVPDITSAAHELIERVLDDHMIWAALETTVGWQVNAEVAALTCADRAADHRWDGLAIRLASQVEARLVRALQLLVDRTSNDLIRCTCQRILNSVTDGIRPAAWASQVA